MTNPARLTLRPLTVDDAPEASREILQASLSRSGTVPNMYAVMAHSPGLLRTYRFGYDELARGSGFDAAEQAVTFLTLSRYHVCTYCVAVHSAAADRASVPTEVVDAIRDGRPIDDARLEALSRFVARMVETRGQPGQDELDAFLAAGYTEPQVLEVILAIAVKTISNYTNHVFDTPLDAFSTKRAWAPGAD